MFNSPRQERQHQRRPIWNMLFVVVAVLGMLGFYSGHVGQAHAAPMRSSTHPAFPSIDQTKRSAASYHPTPAEVAYAADKGRLSQEYVHGVLTGQETLATFETHYRTFMIKWNLGNVANLHTALTRSTARLLSGRPVTSLCPSLSSSSSLSANGTTASCPVYAAQFPEENFNWCGPATLATTLVEDSWAWPGTTQYNGYTLSYDAYQVTQPQQTASNDEYWLATHGVISGDVMTNGTSPDQMTTVVDEFVNGKGGWYAQEWLSGSTSSQISDFQGKVSTDIGTGWDVPDGILIGSGEFNSMPGYPYTHPLIDHYVPVTFISSDLNTTYYADPIYASPAYDPSQWTVPPPYEYTSTSNIVWWTQLIIW